MLGQSLLAFRDIRQDGLYACFRALVHGGMVSPLTGEPGYSWGSLTRKVLEPGRYADSLTRTDLPLRASNGSLMRTAPIALFFSTYVHSDLIAAARAASYVTHRHQGAGECCAFYALVLEDMLSGCESTMWALENAWDDLCAEGDVYRWFMSFNDFCGLEPSDNPGLWHGSASRSLSVAFWALAQAPDFETGVTEVIKLGGDTHRNAAIAGGLLGARFGYSGIPVDWREGVAGHNVLCNLADNLIREGAK